MSTQEWEELVTEQPEQVPFDWPVFIGTIVVSIGLSILFYHGIKQENVDRQEQLEAVP